jgi:Helix-turn-helix domain
MDEPGRTLERLRTARGHSRAQLAALTEGAVGAPQIWRIETGAASHPRAGTKASLAWALGAEVEEIWPTRPRGRAPTAQPPYDPDADPEALDLRALGINSDPNTTTVSLTDKYKVEHRDAKGRLLAIEVPGKVLFVKGGQVWVQLAGVPSPVNVGPRARERRDTRRSSRAGPDEPDPEKPRPKPKRAASK